MPDYSLAELVALSGLPSRTIRYYIAEGLIPSPGRDGPGTRYPETTLAKLRLIGKLRDAHQPLSEIRARLEALTEDELIALAATATSPVPADSALDYIRSVLGEGSGQLRATAPTFFARAMAAPAAAPASTPAAVPQPPPATPAAPLAPAAQAAPQIEPSAPTSTISERSQWERIALAPGIELHVRRPQSRRENRMVERLIAFARQLQGEDQL